MFELFCGLTWQVFQHHTVASSLTLSQGMGYRIRIKRYKIHELRSRPCNRTKKEDIIVTKIK